MCSLGSVWMHEVFSSIHYTYTHSFRPQPKETIWVFPQVLTGHRHTFTISWCVVGVSQMSHAGGIRVGTKIYVYIFLFTSFMYHERLDLWFHHWTVECLCNTNIMIKLEPTQDKSRKVTWVTHKVNNYVCFNFISYICHVIITFLISASLVYKS